MSEPYIPLTANSALRRFSYAEPFFCRRYSLSPYRACAHACRYCDGRAEKYYVEGNFDQEIQARTNLPSLLAKELPNLREKGIISLGSGVSDVYQPLEAKLQLTGRCAGILAESKQAAFVLTKNALIQRDLSLWKKVNKRGGFILGMTLVTDDETVREIFEPGASPLSERLDTLRSFKEAGIPIGVYAMPALPGISDSEDILQPFYQKLAETGVDFIIPGCLTLRPGCQKDTYLQIIHEQYPELTSHYEELYREERASGAPIRPYTTAFMERAGRILAELHIPWLIPHRIYRGRTSLCDEIHILLDHMQALYQAKGISVKPLKKASGRYNDWLGKARARFNRKKGLPDDYLDEELRLLAETRNLKGLLNNEKLADFLTEVIGGASFDYCTLKLQ